MSTPLRIAMLGTRGMPTSYGGVERAVEELSAGLAARGHDVTVYCRTAYSDVRAPVCRGVRLQYHPTLATKHLEAIVHTSIATVDALTRGFDVLHFHGTGPSLLVPLPRLLGVPVVATVQGLDAERAKWGTVARRVLRVGAWTSARAAERTIVVSRALDRYFRDTYGIDPVYIPNGIHMPAPPSASPPLGLPAGGYFLFLGRLVPEKAIHLLIRAYRELETDLLLVIAGPSSHTDEYVALLEREASKDARVRLVGPIYGDEKEALLSGALAFCQPSDLEGLPIALLEAMSHSRVSIVSDLPEHLEVINEAPDAAWTFRQGDTASLRNALASVLEHRDELERRGAAARALVTDRYLWDDIVTQVEQVYSELVGTGAASRVRWWRVATRGREPRGRTQRGRV